MSTHSLPRTDAGIFGYYSFNVSTNLQQVLDNLFNGLKRLEYRGYDSAGIALDAVDPFHVAEAAEGSIIEENGLHDTSMPLIVKVRAVHGGDH